MSVKFTVSLLAAGSMDHATLVCRVQGPVISQVKG
jgi:hypothetical protein